MRISITKKIKESSDIKGAIIHDMKSQLDNITAAASDEQFIDFVMELAELFEADFGIDYIRYKKL
jgi:hypothetical protein